MQQSVTAYIADSPVERQAALKHLRKLCRAVLAGYQEAIEYGMPAYKRNGVVEVAFASST